MGRLDHRRGRAPLLTATELSELLPIPLLMIVEGKALARFPKTDRSGPSVAVTVVPSSPDPRMNSLGFPVVVHWTQWKNVAVPVLQNLRVYDWRGKVASLGDVVALLHSIVGPGGVVLWAEGTEVGSSTISEREVGHLYSCDPPSVRGTPQSKTYQYLDALKKIILAQAQSKGY